MLTGIKNLLQRVFARNEPEPPGDLINDSSEVAVAQALGVKRLQVAKRPGIFELPGDRFDEDDESGVEVEQGEKKTSAGWPVTIKEGEKTTELVFRTKRELKAHIDGLQQKWLDQIMPAQNERRYFVDFYHMEAQAMTKRGADVMSSMLELPPEVIKGAANYAYHGTLDRHERERLDLEEELNPRSKMGKVMFASAKRIGETASEDRRLIDLLYRVRDIHNGKARLMHASELEFIEK